jgi:hypothetical protein
MDIVVDLFETLDATWWWRAEHCKLVRGPFVDREEAEDDASDNAQDLIVALRGDDDK